MCVLSTNLFIISWINFNKANTYIRTEMPALPLSDNCLPKHRLYLQYKDHPQELEKQARAREHTGSDPLLFTHRLLSSDLGWLELVRELSNGRRSSATHQGLLRSGRAGRGRADDGVGAGAVAQAAGEAVGFPEGVPGLLQQPRRSGPVRGGVHAAAGRRVRAVQEPDGAVGDTPVGARRPAGAPRPPPAPPARHRRGGRLHALRRRAPRRPPRVPGPLPLLPRGGRRLPRQGQALLQPAGGAGERVQVRGPAGERGGGAGGGQGAGRGGEGRRREAAGGERGGGPDPDDQEQAAPGGDLQVLQGDARQAHRGGPRPGQRGDVDPAGGRAVPRRAGQVLQPGDRGGAEGRGGSPWEGGPDEGGGDEVGPRHGRDQGGLPGAVRGQAGGRHRGQGARPLQGRAALAGGSPPPVSSRELEGD